MILTLTPNPSIDRTVVLDGELTRGQVHRVSSVTSQAGGKGVNISRAAVSADIPSIAVVPAAKEDPFVLELLGAGDRAKVGVFAHRVALLEGTHRSQERVDEVVVDLLVHVDALHGAATLAGVVHRAVRQ